MSGGSPPISERGPDRSFGVHPRIEPWALTTNEFVPDSTGHFEALFALGNGFWVNRGSALEAEQVEPHYPGTYRAGLYDRRIDWVNGEPFEHEDLVNLPNGLSIRWRRPGGEWVLRNHVELLEFEQKLCLRRGLLTSRWSYREANGNVTRVHERRLFHMALPHVAAVELSLEAENWAGTFELCSAIDARIENANVEAYAGTDGNHLEAVRAERLDEQSVLLEARTLGTRIGLAIACRTTGIHVPAVSVGVGREARLVALMSEQHVEPGKPIRLEKVATLFTGLDVGVSQSREAAQRELEAAPGFSELLATHEQAWSRLWQRFSLEIEGQPQVTGALRFHLFQLLQTLSPHTTALDVGIPGRGWHGEGYRGHIFWDELFVFPLLVVRLPELARALLLYRHRRLPEARRAARAAGFRGALFPWRSASDGREVTEKQRKNPRSGRWIADNSQLQRHLNAAVAYNVWRYFEVTLDYEFIEEYGAELLVETAQFWASAAQWDAERRRFVINGVVGPDEFHDAYTVGSQSTPSRPGVNNNAYTNLMAVWNIKRALDALRLVSTDCAAELRQRLEVTDETLAKWQRLTREMFVPYADGIIEQFEGFRSLEPFPWKDYKEKYGDIHRLDDILEAEGDTTNRFQACKQADVLMLFYLLPPEEVASTLTGLGYEVTDDLLKANLAFYLERTTHGSTLSRVVHARVLARSDRRHSWDMLKKALGSDLSDIQNGTTKEGLHLGAMAGTVDVFQSCYLGLQFRAGELWIDPILPDGIDGVAMRLRVQAAWLDVSLRHSRLALVVQQDARHPVRVRFRGTFLALQPGEERSFQLDDVPS